MKLTTLIVFILSQMFHACSGFANGLNKELGLCSISITPFAQTSISTKDYAFAPFPMKKMEDTCHVSEYIQISILIIFD